MQITLHPSLTGGIGNGAAGDQGLLVVVEPRDQAGNIVVAPGQTSVALIDPALRRAGPLGAVGLFRRRDAGECFIPGPSRAFTCGCRGGAILPTTGMKVFVRYTTRDGRMFQAEQTIAVALGDDGAAAAGRAEVRDRADCAGRGPADHPTPGEDQPRPPDPRNAVAAAPQWSPDRD